MGAIVLAAGLCGIFGGEPVRLPPEGLGGDGWIYADAAIHFGDLLRGNVADKRIQRFLPSAAVHYAFLALDVPFSPENIVRGFRVLNLVLLLGSVFAYAGIADILDLDSRSRWIGFIALYLNFATAKMPWYYPVLTDVPAFFLGMTLLYFFLLDSPAGIVATSLAAACTWPSIPYYALLLMSFRQTKTTAPFPRGRVPAAAAAAATAGFLWMMHDGFTRWGGSLWTGARDPGGGSLRLLQAVAMPSYVSFCVVTFFALRALLDDTRLFRPASLRREFAAVRCAVMLGLMAAVYAFVHAMSASTAAAPMRGNYIFETVEINLTRAVAAPLIFLVSHVAYFGPIVYLTIYFWKDFCRLIHERGAGLTACMIFALCVLVPNSESRHAMDLFPFFAIFTVKAAERIRWDGAAILFFALLSLVFSKVGVDLDRMPDRSLYYMNFGPWMPPLYYYAQAAIALAAGIIFHLYLSMTGRMTAPARSAIVRS